MRCALNSAAFSIIPGFIIVIICSDNFHVRISSFEFFQSFNVNQAYFFRIVRQIIFVSKRNYVFINRNFVLRVFDFFVVFFSAFNFSVGAFLLCVIFFYCFGKESLIGIFRLFIENYMSFCPLFVFLFGFVFKAYVFLVFAVIFITNIVFSVRL